MGEPVDLNTLRQQLAALQKERDGLQRKLEQLTQDSNGSNTTSRAAELLWDAEKQLDALKTELAIVRGERDSLLDDVSQIRAAKRTSDSGWRAEKQRLEELEKRLALYRSNMLQQARGGSSSSSGSGGGILASPTAGTTDRTTIELLLAKDSIVRLEGELTAARTTATAEQNMRMLAEQQLSAVRQQLADLTRAGPQVSAGSGSSQEQQALVLSSVRSELLRAQVEAQQVKEALQATRQQHEEQLAGLRKDIRNLHKELNERSAHAQDLELLVEQTSAALAVSQAAVKELQYVATYGGTSDLVRSDSQQGALRELRLEVLQLQAQCKHYEAQCDQAAAEKQHLQQQLAAAVREADEAQDVVAQTQGYACDLKLQLAQAAREKVEVLLQLSAQLAIPQPSAGEAGHGVAGPRLPLSGNASPRGSEDGSPLPCSPVLQGRRVSSSSDSRSMPQGAGHPALVSSAAGQPAATIAAGLWQMMKLPRLLSGRGSVGRDTGVAAAHGEGSPKGPGEPTSHQAGAAAVSSHQPQPPRDNNSIGFTPDTDSCEAAPALWPASSAAAAGGGAWVAGAVAVAGDGCGDPATPYPPPADTSWGTSGGAAGQGEQADTRHSSSSPREGAPVLLPKQHRKGAAAAATAGHVVPPMQLRPAACPDAGGQCPAAGHGIGAGEGQLPAQAPPSVAGTAEATLAQAGTPGAQQRASAAAASAVAHQDASVLQQEQHAPSEGAHTFKEGYAPCPGLVQARRNMFGGPPHKGP